VNLDYSPEDLAFRDEVRAFIAAEYPAELRAKQDAGEELTIRTSCPGTASWPNAPGAPRPGRSNTAVRA
jgi:hypothetical protein